MPGRRRETRFLPSSPWNAALQLVDDVVLERTDDGQILVTGGTPAARGDDLTLEVATGGLRLGVRVVQVQPVLIDGALHHRLRLDVLAAEGEDPTESLWKGPRA